MVQGGFQRRSGFGRSLGSREINGDRVREVQDREARGGSDS
ncbi:hypothetical protein TIFTF001_013175 [Ficus carica]|uniref:Uncharacterized protein n=1 Tax=Ficus carica TaxID=3494 RepID=A0AA88APH0_FICCA|nr:hypothetical protein TIFTF001_013175 [Ficus carica]